LSVLRFADPEYPFGIFKHFYIFILKETLTRTIDYLSKSLYCFSSEHNICNNEFNYLIKQVILKTDQLTETSQISNVY
jgi:hypothetical protein